MHAAEENRGEEERGGAAQFAGKKWPHGKPLPSLPPEFHALQLAKDNIILGHLSTIQSGFGAARFQHLDNFVQAAIAPHITLTTARQPAPATADQGKTLRRLPPVAWLK